MTLTEDTTKTKTKTHDDRDLEHFELTHLFAIKGTAGSPEAIMLLCVVCHLVEEALRFVSTTAETFFTV